MQTFSCFLACHQQSNRCRELDADGVLSGRYAERKTRQGKEIKTIIRERANSTKPHTFPWPISEQLTPRIEIDNSTDVMSSSGLFALWTAATACI